MQDVGEFLERLGRQLGRMERRHGRSGERWSRRWGFEGLWDDDEETKTDGEERELTFGEHPELRLKVNMTSVYLHQVEAGGKARITARGRGLVGVEIATAEDGAVDVRATRGFFDGPQRLNIYVPAGTRVRAAADAGKLVAEGLTETELDLRTEAGKLDVRNCHGRMRITSSAGKLDVVECSGSLEARADAGKVQVRDFTGALTAHADAGSIRCSAIRLEPGEHMFEAALGSIDLALVPDVPVRIEARASLGSVRNSIGEGQADAPVRVRVRTELGSVRIRYDEEKPTPLHRVPLFDERDSVSEPGHAASRPVDMQSVPVSDGHEGDDTGASTSGSQPAGAARNDEVETLRILGMVERHEISAEEGATLLAALRR